MGDGKVNVRKLVIKEGMTPQDVKNNPNATAQQKAFACVFDSDGVEGYSAREAKVFNSTTISCKGEKGITLWTQYQDGTKKGTSVSGDVTSFKYAPQGDVKPQVCECEKTKGEKPKSISNDAQLQGKMQTISKAEFDDMYKKSIGRDDFSGLRNYGERGLFDGNVYILFDKAEDREKFAQMVSENNVSYNSLESEHNAKYLAITDNNNRDYLAITDKNNREYMAIENEYNRRWQAAYDAGEPKAELDKITQERIQKQTESKTKRIKEQQAAKQKRITEQENEKKSRISDLAKKATQNDVAKANALYNMNVRVYAVGDNETKDAQAKPVQTKASPKSGQLPPLTEIELLDTLTFYSEEDMKAYKKFSAEQNAKFKQIKATEEAKFAQIKATEEAKFQQTKAAEEAKFQQEKAKYANSSKEVRDKALYGTGGAYDKKQNALYGTGGAYDKKQNALYGTGGAYDKKQNALYGTGGAYDKKENALNEERQKRCSQVKEYKHK